MGGGETGVAVFGVGTVPRDSVLWLFALGEGFEVLKIFVEMVTLGGGKGGYGYGNCIGKMGVKNGE